MSMKHIGKVYTSPDGSYFVQKDDRGYWDLLIIVLVLAVLPMAIVKVTERIKK